MKRIIILTIMLLFPAIASASPAPPGSSWDSMIWDTDCWDQACSVGPDTTPDPFSFTAQTGVALNTVVTSNTITVSGINSPAAIALTSCSSSSCQYSIDGGATWASSAGLVNNGAVVEVRQTSSGAYFTTTTATLSIGGVSGAFNVTTMAPPPDLVISSLSVSGSTTTGPGGSLSVIASTWNRGVGNAGASTTKFYLASGSCSGAQTEMTGNRYIASLAAGATDAPGAISTTVPSMTPGTYYLVATADAGGQVAESSEANNSRCWSTPITVQGTGAGDLAIQSASGSSLGYAGKTISLAYTTWNRGTGPADASITKVYLRCLPNADLELESKAIIPLGAGLTYPYATHAVAIPSGALGGLPSGSSCSLVIWANKGASPVPETNSANNTRTLTITIK